MPIWARMIAWYLPLSLMITYYHLERFGFAREAVEVLTDAHPDLDLKGSADSSDTFEASEKSGEIQVLLLDMDLERDTMEPLARCLELCIHLKALKPEMKILLHSPYNHAGWLSRFVEAKVTGFVSKNTAFAEVSKAMHVMVKGDTFICPVIAEQFSNFNEYVSDHRTELKSRKPDFTSREREVLELMAKGLTSKAIALRLFLSEKTIESHRRSLLHKAQVKNSAELIRFVSLQGLLIP